MPTTANTINYYVAADGTLRDGEYGSIAQQPRLNYGTDYAVTLSFPPSTIAEGDQLQVALNRTRTFFSSASATGDAPVAAVSKHDVTAVEAAAQEVTLTLSTNTRAMIDQVNGIDHPVRGFFGVHVLRGQSFVTLAVTDALMMSLESGPDAISPPLPILDYPTRQEMNDAVHAAETAAENAQTSEDNAETYAGNAADEAQAARTSANAAGNSATLAESYAHGGTGTRQGEDTDNAKYYLEQLGDHEAQAKAAAQAAAGSATAAAGSAIQAATAAGNAAGSVTQAGQAATAATTAKNAAETAQGKAEAAQGKSEDAQTAAETAQRKAEDAQGAAETAQVKAEDAQEAAETARDAAVTAKGAAEIAESNAAKIAEGTDEEVAPLGLEHSAKGWAEEASERMTVVTIPAATTSYTLQDNKHYQQVPSDVPTYTLPTVTMDGLVHEITVLVDFLHVTSCSFVDASGVPVTLQSSISPSIGEAYIFRCYWYGKWRVVPMKIRNAATVSSATGVVEVSDAVAGDALALKMTAPRSVVVNQLVQNGDFGDSLNHWHAQLKHWTRTVSNNTALATFSRSSDSQNMSPFLQDIVIPANHTVLVSFDYKLTAQNTSKKSYIGYIQSPTQWISMGSDTFNTWNTKSVKFSLTTASSYLNIGPYGYATSSWDATDGDTFELKNVQIVDLTQYFNGDSALIDSITSWDDLVAYDPRFAQYVEYNTGTVTGVQPTVKVTGKNLLNLADIGPITSQKPIYISPNVIVPAGTYTLSALMTETNLSSEQKFSLRLFYKYADNVTHATLGLGVSGGSSKRAKETITFLQRTILTHVIASGTVSGYSGTVSNIQLELGSTPTSYEPYHDGGTAQAPSPLFAVGTAADEFEAVAGVTTRKMASVDLGTLTWTLHSTNRVFYTQEFQDASFAGVYDISNIVCDKYVTVNYVTMVSTNKTIAAAGTTKYVYVKDTDYTDAAAFKASMSGVMLYYELAAPTTSASTPTQISLQAGNNVAMQTDGGRTLGELAMTYENLPTEG